VYPVVVQACIDSVHPYICMYVVYGMCLVFFFLAVKNILFVFCWIWIPCALDYDVFYLNGNEINGSQENVPNVSVIIVTCMTVKRQCNTVLVNMKLAKFKVKL